MKKIVIANWKMFLNHKETELLTRGTLKNLKKIKNLEENLEIVLCPSFISLPLVSELIKQSSLPVAIGAQDVFWQERGAVTGEVSVLTLKEINTRYVIIGHSERRQNLKETDQMVNWKIKITLKNNLIPILCLGETFQERKRGEKEKVIIRQLNKALKGVKINSKNQLVVAYEPVWAIGSGLFVEPLEAEKISQLIRKKLISLTSKDQIRLIYGGSVDERNIKSFIKQKTIDGVLIGTTSLKKEKFVGIIKKILEFL